MATSISFNAVGTAAAGTTSCAPTYPATVNAGDLIILGVVSKYGTPTTPTGFTLTSGATKEGGVGTTGVDTGLARATVYWKIADGTEGGTTVTVNQTSGNVTYAQIHRYTRTNTFSLNVAATGGAVNTANLAWSATMDADVGLVTDDFTFFWSGLNTDNASAASEAATATGVVWGALTERFDTGTGSGDDVRGVSAGGSIASGTSSAAAVFVMTCTGTAPAGATVLVRFREFTLAGAASITEAGDTVVSAGTQTINGAAAITEAGDTVTAAGMVGLINGAASITEAGDSVTATGTSTINGTVSITEAGDSLSAAGTVDNGEVLMTGVSAGGFRAHLGWSAWSGWT